MADQAEGPAPLDGVRVADFSELLPGPFLTQSLVELGAEVIKIERPPRGDATRVMLPGLFKAVNRGKKSVALNLKTADGLAQAREIISASDIVVEGYRPVGGGREQAGRRRHGRHRGRRAGRG